ncbi:MAG: FIST C-terminal domain-containing protein [Planctomycetaceae bacterium]|nr:FIST C-terminal domain-containing protein [Planctomycetaceae bacterium]
MMTAHTVEIDDPDAAFNEIMRQLGEMDLCANSVGIITCHYDYVSSGAVKNLCDAIQFDVVGCTVVGCAVNARGGVEQLSLTVITSDEIEFSVAMSDIITRENVVPTVEKAYADARQKFDCEPSLIFTFGPIMQDVSGSEMLKTLDRISSGVPVFGTLSSDTSLRYEESYVICNGDYHIHKLTMILFKGNIKPRFYTTAIATQNIHQQSGIVTDSEGYLLRTVNNVTIADYFTTLGIKISDIAAVAAIPFLLDFRDGTAPVARSIYHIAPEGVYTGGEIPVGAMITFADIDYNSVMITAQATLELALEDVAKNGANGIIAIPCLTRAFVIMPNTEDEIKKSMSIVGDKIPFSLIYSGGELCPVYNQQNKTVNRFHNLTYTLMVF